MEKNKWIHEHEDYLIGIAQKIWEKPELSFEEHQSCNLLATELENNGFTVERGCFGLETAFRATWGSGQPVIGFLAEYDCLPGLSQKAVPYKEPVVENGLGHGCGHNLLGTSNFAAAIDLQQQLITSGAGGTVVCYGTPAEEGGGGKIIMAQNGAFKELDIVLSSHPCIANFVSEGSGAAIVSANFTFKGITSHAAAAPEGGRSALDALELMHVGINYLREHVSRDVRMHYVIINGGLKSNIVPEYAENAITVRAATIREAREVFERVIKVAKGAAIMTETEYSYKITGGCYNYLVNYTVARTMHQCLSELNGINWSGEEMSFAEKLVNPYGKSHIDASIINYVTKRNYKELDGKILHDGIIPLLGESFFSPGSSDITDVSWIVPTGVVETCCRPIGIGAHTWEQTACAGMSIGHKGMLLAAKTLANTGYAFVTNPHLIQQAKEELLKQCEGEAYIPVSQQIF